MNGVYWCGNWKLILGNQIIIWIYQESFYPIGRSELILVLSHSPNHRRGILDALDLTVDIFIHDTRAHCCRVFLSNQFWGICVIVLFNMLKTRFPDFVVLDLTLHYFVALLLLIRLIPPLLMNSAVLVASKRISSVAFYDSMLCFWSRSNGSLFELFLYVLLYLILLHD